MKKNYYLSVLLVAILAMAGLTACDDDELIGIWPPMEWESHVDLRQTIPASGGTYTFTCKNYGFWISHMEIDGVYYYPDSQIEDPRHFKGDWFSVDLDNDQKVMTVTFSHNDSGKQRELMIVVEAGDTFDSFCFRQAFM